MSDEQPIPDRLEGEAVQEVLPLETPAPKPAQPLYQGLRHEPPPPGLTQPLSGDRPSLFLRLMLVLLALLVGFYLHERRDSQAVSAPAPTAAALPSATVYVQPAPPIVFKPKAKATTVPTAIPTVTARTVLSKPKPAKAKPTAPVYATLNYDRQRGTPWTLKAWRAEGATASLDIFGERNQRVRSLQSEAGPAGLVEIAWDGNDTAGQPVPLGLYYMRPSAEGLETLREVRVTR